MGLMEQNSQSTEWSWIWTLLADALGLSSVLSSPLQDAFRLGHGILASVAPDDCALSQLASLSAQCSSPKKAHFKPEAEGVSPNCHVDRGQSSDHQEDWCQGWTSLRAWWSFNGLEELE